MMSPVAFESFRFQAFRDKSGEEPDYPELKIED